MEICTICFILAMAIGSVLLSAAIGYTIMTIWGVVGKVVLTVELLLIFAVVIAKSWDRVVN